MEPHESSKRLVLSLWKAGLGFLLASSDLLEAALIHSKMALVFQKCQLRPPGSCLRPSSSLLCPLARFWWYLEVQLWSFDILLF